MPGYFDPEVHLAFCHEAERYGIESLLMAFGSTRPDPFAWSCALGMSTERIKFLIAIRSGISVPTYFVQQVNTIGILTGGRVCINVVAGRHSHEQRFYGDFLEHDERYTRTDEFWRICHALWSGAGPVDFAGRHYRVEGATLNTPFTLPGQGLPHRPEIYVGGSSTEAANLAVRHGDCLLTFADAPDRLAARIGTVLDSGTSVGLAVGLIAGPTHQAALASTATLVDIADADARRVHDEHRSTLDSVGFASTYAMADDAAWVTPHLWTGAVPYHGPAAAALVGSADEIVDALFEYRSIGVTQFLFIGYPDDFEQMTFFGQSILPRIREREAAHQDLSRVNRSAGHVGAGGQLSEYRRGKHA